MATVAVYYPVRSHPFFGLDDPLYLTNNPYVLGPLNWAAVKWAFTHNYCLNYDPVTFLAHSVNVRLFALNAVRHHEVNIVLHAVNAIVLLWLLRRYTGYWGRSFVVAALFALHPTAVENVAWVAELKTLLSTLFFFLAIGTYHWYVVRPSQRRMALVVFLYIVGLLAKPQIITLPFVLLLLDYWPLRRMFADGPSATSGTAGVEAIAPASFRQLIREKSALFLITAADALVTLVAEHKASPKDWPYTFSIRLGNAILSYSRYLGKAFWPVHLSYLYPHPGYSLRCGQVWASLAFLIAATVFVLVNRRRRYLPVGWFWFLGVMVPMIGLVQIDMPALADRWAYTGFVGIYLMVSWSVAEWAEGGRLRKSAVQVATATALIALALLTRHQTTFWKDDLTVWSHSVEVNGRNWQAETVVGGILENQGQYDEALRHLRRAEEDASPDRNLFLRIAIAERHRGNLEEAIRYYRKVLAIPDPEGPQADAQVWANMGHAYGELGDADHARECFQTALRIRPTSEANGPGPVIH